MSTTSHELSALSRSAVPCPAWCPMGAGHPYDQTTHEGDNLIRVHEVDAGAVELSDGRSVSATVDTCETVTADGRVTLTPPRAALFDTGALDDLTRDDLAALAAFLERVSARLAEVEAVEAAAVPAASPSGRALAEQVLQVIDDKGLSVADVAQSAGLPVAEVWDVLHDHPERLTLRTALLLADALRVPLDVLMARATGQGSTR